MLGGLEGLPSLLIYKYEYTSANYHKTSPGQCEVHHAHRTPLDIEHHRTPWRADGAGPDIRGIAENYRSHNTLLDRGKKSVSANGPSAKKERVCKLIT